MKTKILYSVCFISSVCFSQNPSNSSSCSPGDIGVENGNFGTWQGFTGTVSSGPVVTLSPAALPAAGQISIVPPPGIDPCSNASNPVYLPAPGSQFSIQLGNNQTGCGAERITHVFTVTPQDTNFIYQYSVVMQDPGHAPSDQPFLELAMYNQNNNVIPCSYQKIVAGPSLPGFYTSATCSQVYYKPWTFTGVNLSAYIGQQVTVMATNGDCALCGHYGYSYLDFSCGPLILTNTFCQADTSVLVNAPIEPGFTYSWSTGQTISAITVNPQITDTVTVQVMSPSGCSFYLTYILIPTIINAGFTHTITGNTVSFTDTTGITGGNIVGWSWNFGDGNTSSSQNPVHTYSVSGTYTVCLVVNSAAGCMDTACQIIILPPISVNDTELFSSINIFPNPSSGNLFLDFGNRNFGKAEIFFSNIIGQTLFETTIPANGKQAMDVSGFSDGIYFLKLKTDYGIVTKKIVIAK